MILQHLFYDKNPKVYKKQNKTKKKPKQNKTNKTKTKRENKFKFRIILFFSQPILTCQIMEIADLLMVKSICSKIEVVSTLPELAGSWPQRVFQFQVFRRLPLKWGGGGIFNST